MGRGGYRTRTLLWIVVALGSAAAALSLLMGHDSVPSLVLMAVILILVLTESARSWFHETEA
jgi:hypothetical protein